MTSSSVFLDKQMICKRKDFKMKKRIFSVIMAMVFSATLLMPVAARADDYYEDSEGDYDYSDDYSIDDDYSDDNDDYDEDVPVDYSNAALKDTDLTVLASKDWGDSYTASGQIEITGLPEGSYADDEDISNITSQNPNIKADSYSLSISENVLEFEVEGTGSTTISFMLGTKQLSFHLRILVPLSMKSNSYVLTRGHKVKLKLFGDKSGVKLKYQSLKPSVASVNSRGQVKAKKPGTAVIRITADYGETKDYIGTVINVTTSKKSAVFRWARSYAAKSKYSQAKRMQKGYYDCSSLVWRAYKSRGISLLNKNYAPTAADLAKYLVGKGRKVGNASLSNFDSGKFQIGDLMFETGAKNGRYDGIYHVEMFGGYALNDFDESGKPELSYNFANLQYYPNSANIICRP